MFQGLKNLHKLFSKKYMVLFFDKDNMPEDGTFITIGDLTGVLKKDRQIQDTEVAKKVVESINETLVWVCRKCGYREVKK